MSDLVEIGALREYVLSVTRRGDMTWADIARRLGYMRDAPETDRVAVALGLTASRKGGYYAKTMNPARWRAYAEAIHALGGEMAEPVPGRRGQPSVDSLVEAMQSAGITCCALARRLGYMRSFADTSRLQRTLGARAWKRGPGWSVNHRATYDTAVRIAKIVGADPVEVGL
jgi:hypothetical protein